MREFLHVAAVVLGVLIGCLWILIGLLLAGIGWVTIRRRLASIFWPQVPARIVASEVRSVRHLEDHLYFQPVVSFVFAAEGGEVSSGQLSLVGKLYSSEARAGKEVEKYPVGLVVMARANPRDPGEAVLKRGGGITGFLLSLLGVGLAGAPLVVAAKFGLPAWPLAILLIVLAAVALLLDGASRRQMGRARLAGIYPLPGRGSDEDVERLLQQGERMLAIRLFREIHGTDLKTARLRVTEIADRIGPDKAN